MCSCLQCSLSDTYFAENAVVRDIEDMLAISEAIELSLAVSLLEFRFLVAISTFFMEFIFLSRVGPFLSKRFQRQCCLGGCW